MSLTTLSLAGKIQLFPPRESLVSDIPAGDRKIGNLFYSVSVLVKRFPCGTSYGSETCGETLGICAWGWSREYWMIYCTEDRAFSPSYDLAPPHDVFFKIYKQSFWEGEKCSAKQMTEQSALKIEDLRYWFFTPHHPFLRKREKNVVEALKTKFLWLEISIFYSRLPHFQKKRKQRCLNIVEQLQVNRSFVTDNRHSHF